jgi:hypothetical protein
MLTPSEMQNVKINPLVAKEAYDQAEKRLNDIAEARRSIEQKATALFSAYVTISLALLGVGGAILKNPSLLHALPFLVSGFVFMIGACFFVISLRSRVYGAIGSLPEMWLKHGTIDGGENAVSAMQAYLTYYCHQRIVDGMKSNSQKVKWLHWGMWSGIVAAVAFFIISFLVATTG